MLRIDGENVRVNDQIAISWASMETVATVAIVGQVKRVVLYDEATGREIAQPFIVVEDNRTGEEVTILRRDVDRLAQIDGPWMSPAEMKAAGIN